MARVPQCVKGFTVAELLIVVAIIGILAALAVSAYQTHTVRTQVSDGIDFVSSIKVPIEDAYLKSGSLPSDRVEAGMTQPPADSKGTYVTEVAIVNGRIDVTFGNRAHPDIAAQTLSLTPYVTAGNSVIWRCGNAPAPADGVEFSSGGITAEHRPPTIDGRYLPGNCR